MSSPRSSRSVRAEALAGDGYWHIARRPLQILAFLGPLIIAYELCLALVLPAADGLRVTTVEAHKRLLEFFATFGIAPAGGLYLGGLVIILVLLAWHILARERWIVNPKALALMAVEAVGLALPLLVLSRLVATGQLAAGTPSAFGELDVWSQMAISVGAGLYEELTFRMILIAVLHTLLVDLGKVSHWVGAVVAIVISAAAFTWYHDLHGPDGAISTQRVLFYVLAGLYFGAVYTLRGFGLVVGAHALYDIITVATAAGDASG